MSNIRSNICMFISINSHKDQWPLKSSCWSWWWFWCSWLGLVSLMTLSMVCKCPEGDMFEIWLKSNEFEGIKNPLKDWWHLYIFGWNWLWFWCFWLGLVSLVMFWMVSKCPDKAMFKIWLKSDEFEGIKNPLKDQWHCCSCCWSLWWSWAFLTEVGVFYNILDGLNMPSGGYV